MAEETFQEEFDLFTTRVRDLQNRIDALEKPRRDLVLVSPDGKFRVEVALKDGARLVVRPLIFDAATHSWKSQPGPGERVLAAWQRGPDGELTLAT